MASTVAAPSGNSIVAAAASVINTTISGLFNTSGEKAKKAQINAQTAQINQKTADLELELEQAFGLKQQTLANTTNSTNLNNTLSNVSAVETARLQAQANSNMITTIALCVGW
jgi:hypothetical protein